jgi:hypothetical protein
MPAPIRVLKAMGFTDGVQGPDLDRYNSAVEGWHTALRTHGSSGEAE